MKNIVIVSVISAVILVTGLSLILITHREKYSPAWKEMNRKNMMFEKYPPCYDICGATRSIYNYLEEIDKDEEYHKLLDVYSIVLCQEKFRNSDKVKEMMLQRIDDLISLGAEKNNVFGTENIINKYNPNNPIVKDFMYLATNLIQREINRLSKDNIDAVIKEKIEKLNEIFYEVHYPIIAVISNISF